MENKKVLKISLFALPLAVTMLGGCSEKEPEHIHTYIEHAAVAATCKEGGNEMYFTCEGCNKVFDADKKETTLADVQIAKLNHSLTHHDAVPGQDCKQEGTIEYWDCSLCSQKFSDSEGKNVITSIVGTFGEHTFIDHAAKSATCTEGGSEAYAECSACEKYFTADHETEIEKDSWIVGALGHSWSLEVSGDYKTTYNVGEVFEKDKLVVKKVCENDSDHNVTLGGEDVELIYQNGSAFAVGDTKVTVKEKGSELKKEITIAVNKLANVITGLEESYESVCGVGVNLAGVSATNGEVSAKYYLDEVEVAEEDLEGGNTYEVVVSSDGLNPSYEIATATATLVVKHEYVAEPSKLVIGYKNKVCSACDDVVESDELMETEDIDLTMADDNGLPCAYGINGDMFTYVDGSGNLTEGCSVVNAPCYYNPAGETKSKTIAFPKIDYKLYSNVIYVIESNADTWGGGCIGLTLDGEDFITEESHGRYPHGTIKVVYHEESDGYLDVTLNLSDGYTKTVVIDNPKIIDGESSLTFVGSFGMYRLLCISHIMLNHTTHTGSGTEAVSTSCIGHYDDLCVCGEIAAKGETLMTTAEIDIKETYGAGIVLPESHGDTDFEIDGERLVWHGNNNDVTTLKLPRVEMSAYKEIKFNMYYGCLWGQLGFDSSKTAGNFGDGYNPNEGRADKEAYRILVEIIRLADGSYRAKLSFPAKGNVMETTITDTDVLSGAKSLGLYCGMGGYSQICLESIEVNADYVHEHVYPFVARDVIGTSDISDCTICGKAYEGAAETRVSQTEDVDYSLNLHGATQFCGNSYEHDETSSISSGTEFGGCIKYVPTKAAYAQRKQTLPKIDYSKYVQVEFQIHAKAYYGFSLIGGWEKGEFIHGTEFNGKLLVDVVGENKLNLTLLKSDGTLVNAKTLEGAEGTSVYTGATGVTIYGLIAEGGDFVSVSRPTFNSERQHVVVTVPNPDLIGYKLEKCVACGESTKTSVLMDESELDLSKENAYGANATSISRDNSEGYKKAGSLTWSNNEGATAEVSISLPRVDYASYGKVNFVFYSSTATWGGSEISFGYESNEELLTFAKHGEAATNVMSVVYNDSALTITNRNSDGSVGTATVSDADVISGAKALTLKGKFGQYRSIYLDRIYFGDVLMGASIATGTVAKTATGFVYDPESSYGNPIECFLPAIDYASYGKVEFNVTIKSGSYYPLTKLNDVNEWWNDVPTASGEVNLKLTITNTGTNTITLTLQNWEGETFTKVIENADVVSGKSSASIFFRQSDAGVKMTVSEPTLTPIE